MSRKEVKTSGQLTELKERLQQNHGGVGGGRTLTGGNGRGTALKEGEMLLLEVEGRDAEQTNVPYVHNFSLNKQGGLVQETITHSVRCMTTKLNQSWPLLSRAYNPVGGAHGKSNITCLTGRAMLWAENIYCCKNERKE